MINCHIQLMMNFYDILSYIEFSIVSNYLIVVLQI